MSICYERFNELLFESYCKTCIDNAILKERMKKSIRAQWERSLSTMTDSEIYTLARKNVDLEEVESEDIQFFVRGIEVHVHDSQLARALYRLMPRDREIMLLYYFADMNDDEVAHELMMSRPTVQRRRSTAKEKLRFLLEGRL